MQLGDIQYIWNFAFTLSDEPDKIIKYKLSVSKQDEDSCFVDETSLVLLKNGKYACLSYAGIDNEKTCGRVTVLEYDDEKEACSMYDSLSY